MLILLLGLRKQEGSASITQAFISVPQLLYAVPSCVTLVFPPMANFQLASGIFVSTQEWRWEEISLKVYVYPTNTNEMSEVFGVLFR
jgi:hypothetical protein